VALLPLDEVLMHICLERAHCLYKIFLCLVNKLLGFVHNVEVKFVDHFEKFYTVFHVLLGSLL